jgi:hypothetical protein
LTLLNIYSTLIYHAYDTMFISARFSGPVWLPPASAGGGMMLDFAAGFSRLLGLGFSPFHQISDPCNSTFGLLA